MVCPRLNLSACARPLSAATQYWTVTNISNGLNALAICIEVTILHLHRILLIPDLDGVFLSAHDMGL